MMSKKENIAQYLLHLWQMEDVVRAFREDMTLEQNQFLSELKTMMQQEGVLEQGHTQIAKNTLHEIEDMSEQMCREDAKYRAALMQMQPTLNLLKSKSLNPTQSDIEMMFVFLYSLMMLRLQNKEISQESLVLQKQVTDYLRAVSQRYKDEE